MLTIFIVNTINAVPDDARIAAIPLLRVVAYLLGITIFEDGSVR